MQTQNLIRKIKSLVSIPSTKENPEALNDAVNFVKKQFKNEKVIIKEFRKNGFPSIVVTLKKETNPFLFFNGHLDVVPAAAKEFHAYLKGNRIYGRGAGDMKAACLVMVEVMKFFSRQIDPPSIGLMLSTDEEIGGINGVNYLLNEKKYKSKLALVPDGGKNLQHLVLNEKGILQIKLETKGQAAHGAKPFLGDNAIDKLLDIYWQLKKDIPPIKQGQWKNSMNLGIIAGGQAINQVADQAELMLDVRWLNGKEEKKILNKIKSIAKNYEIMAHGSAFVQSKKNVLIKKYIKTAESILGKKIKFLRTESASDARFFSENQIPVILTKVCSGNIHSNNEWVDIKEVENFYNILISFVVSLQNEKLL